MSEERDFHDEVIRNNVSTQTAILRQQADHIKNQNEIIEEQSLFNRIIVSATSIIALDIIHKYVIQADSPLDKWLFIIWLVLMIVAVSVFSIMLFKVFWNDPLIAIDVSLKKMFKKR